MSADRESIDIKKARAYDLFIILKSEDIERMIQAYIAGLAN